MSPRTALCNAVVTSLIAADTSAQGRVDAAYDWPLTVEETPAIIVFALKKRSDAVPSGTPDYTSTITIDVLARVARAGMKTAMAELDDLVDQIEKGVIGSDIIQRMVQRIPFVDTDIGLTSEGQLHVAQAKLSFGMELPEYWQPGNPVPLTGIDADFDGTAGNGSQFDLEAWLLSTPTPPPPQAER